VCFRFDKIRVYRQPPEALHVQQSVRSKPGAREWSGFSEMVLTSPCESQGKNKKVGTKIRAAAYGGKKQPNKPPEMDVKSAAWGEFHEEGTD
jgi:hypothetical protein